MIKWPYKRGGLCWGGQFSCTLYFTISMHLKSGLMWCPLVGVTLSSEGGRLLYITTFKYKLLTCGQIISYMYLLKLFDDVILNQRLWNCWLMSLSTIFYLYSHFHFLIFVSSDQQTSSKILVQMWSWYLCYTTRELHTEEWTVYISQTCRGIIWWNQQSHCTSLQ